MKEREAQRNLRKYFMVFQDAWQDFLKALEKGEFNVPSKEEGLRCLLFAKCLEIMRQKKFEKPYEILVEDKETSTETRADITLGRWLETGRLVAIELKDSRPVKEIKADIRKLQGFVKNEAAASGFFAMIGNSKYEYRTYLNLKDLGVQQEISETDEAMICFPRKEVKEGKESFYQWKKVKSPYHERPLETLIVGILC